MSKSVYPIARLILLLFALFPSAQAWESSVLTSSQRASFDRLANELIAPCCWREPIAVHRSPEALQMLEEVEQLVMAGRTEAEIKAIYVQRYGDRILADPEGSIGHWLYAVPTALFGCLLILAIRRLQMLRRAAATPVEMFRPDLHERVRQETAVD